MNPQEIKELHELQKQSFKELFKQQPDPDSAAGAREYIDNLVEGQVVLRMPEKLSPASYQEFEDWINLMLRKAKRSIEGSTDE